MNFEYRWWDDSKRIAYFQFEKGWTWQDIYDIAPNINVMLEEVDHVVDAVYNVNNTSIPYRDVALPKMQYLFKNTNPKISTLYVCNGTSFGIKMLEIFLDFTRVWSDKIVVCNTVDEAIQKINGKLSAV